MNCQEQLVQHYGSREGKSLYRYIMEECFSLNQTDILLGKDSKISTKDQLRLEEITQRLLKNEPIQYILGRTTFLEHTFRVRQGVLIPRPETQQLVTMLAKELADTKSKILDIGTGSGCIAISLALMRHQVTAMDISQEALCIARENAQSLHAEVEFIEEDILHPKATAQLWDVIVSNPPYVLESEKVQMDDNVLKYEPDVALFVPDTDPLLYYKAIANFGLKHLKTNGYLYFEINNTQADKTAQMLATYGYTDIKITTDQYEKERFITAHRK